MEPERARHGRHRRDRGSRSLRSRDRSSGARDVRRGHASGRLISRMDGNALMNDRREPQIAIGLIDGAKSIKLSLHGGYRKNDDGAIDDDERELSANANDTLHVLPSSPKSYFRIETTIGIDFH